jgi:hypothetical protein
VNICMYSGFTGGTVSGQEPLQRRPSRHAFMPLGKFLGRDPSIGGNSSANIEGRNKVRLLDFIFSLIKYLCYLLFVLDSLARRTTLVTRAARTRSLAWSHLPAVRSESHWGWICHRRNHPSSLVAQRMALQRPCNPTDR